MMHQRMLFLVHFNMRIGQKRATAQLDSQCMVSSQITRLVHSVTTPMAPTFAHLDCYEKVQLFLKY